MSTTQLINEETRDTASLARFVAAAKSARPLAWQCVERLKAACVQIESETAHARPSHRACLGSRAVDAGKWRSDGRRLRRFRHRLPMHVHALRHRLRRLGARPVHEERVLRQWARAESQGGGRRRPEDFLPLTLRAALPALDAELRALAVLRSEHAGADGSRRLLVGLADGGSVEAVLLPRGGLCVSSQVGCAVGCVFCTTGLGGLERQLGSAEIVAQVALARGLRPVTKVVFMGMGEPAHNLDAVLEAIDLLGTGGGIGHKQLVLSTVGDRRVFERLPQGRVKPALALSLHATDAALRARLLPRAPTIAPDELVSLGDAYARATGYPMQVQWTLLAGINDTAADIDGLERLLAGKYAVLNLIPYNTVDGLAVARPAEAHSRAMAGELHRRGILTKLRHSAGQDVEAGCGQLRARHGDGDRRRIEIVAV